MWDSINLSLFEAPEHYRREGELLNHQNSMSTCAPKCFIRKADLEKDVLTDGELRHLFNLKNGIKHVIQQERSCDGYTPWLQGFHPKEHKEMLMNKEMLEAQRRHANISLMVATLAAVATVIGTVVGAYINSTAAHLGAEATITAAKMQIESQKEIGRQAQPINVTVQMPEIKQPIADRTVPPKTTHDPKSPLP